MQDGTFTMLTKDPLPTSLWRSLAVCITPAALATRRAPPIPEVSRLIDLSNQRVQPRGKTSNARRQGGCFFECGWAVFGILNVYCLLEFAVFNDYRQFRIPLPDEAADDVGQGC